MHHARKCCQYPGSKELKYGSSRSASSSSSLLSASSAATAAFSFFVSAKRTEGRGLSASLAC